MTTKSTLNKHSIRNILILVAFSSLVGCAHFIMRGSVVEKESENEAQVCLGNHEVKTGDRVAFFKIVCSGVALGRASTRPCRKERVGGGTVTQTLNEHMSIIKVDPGVPFEVETIVEKE